MYEVTGGCADENCPKILTDRAAGMVQVQGYIAGTTTEGLPSGEARVTMSLADLEQIAREHLGLL